MEIINYSDMLAASNTIKAIADSAVHTGTKHLEITKAKAIEKISEYIYQTLKPVFGSPITGFSVYANSVRDEVLHVGGTFENVGYKAQLRNNDLGIVVYFSDDGYFIKHCEAQSVARFIRNWDSFKANMDIEILEAIRKYNKRRENQVSSLGYLAHVFEEFQV